MVNAAEFDHALLAAIREHWCGFQARQMRDRQMQFMLLE
jgi:hypothetical protein